MSETNETPEQIASQIDEAADTGGDLRAMIAAAIRAEREASEARYGDGLKDQWVADEPVIQGLEADKARLERELADSKERLTVAARLDDEMQVKLAAAEAKLKEAEAVIAGMREALETLATFENPHGDGMCWCVVVELGVPHSDKCQKISETFAHSFAAACAEKARKMEAVVEAARGVGAWKWFPMPNPDYPTVTGDIAKLQKALADLDKP